MPTIIVGISIVIFWF